MFPSFLHSPSIDTRETVYCMITSEVVVVLKGTREEKR